MIEFLLSTACLFGNSDSCEKSIQAYSKYSGIEQHVDRYGKKYPKLAMLVGAVGLVKQQRLFYKVHGGWHHVIENDSNTLRNTVIYRMDF